MREKAQDGKTFLGVMAADGWHEIEIQDGIDYLMAKDGGNPVQNERGFKTWKITTKVIESEDKPSIGGFVGCLVSEEKGGDLMATILDAAGLWKIICEKFPGDDVTVFDKKIMDGVKTRLPGKTFMVESRLDKNGFAKVISVASYAKYKEIAAGQKEDKKGAGKKEKGAEKTEGAAGAGNDWYN